MEDLKNNKVDCIVMDELPAKAIVNNNPELKIIDNTLLNKRIKETTRRTYIKNKNS